MFRERGIDTNSTLTPTGSHQAHGRLAFRIVKERYSDLEPGPSSEGPRSRRRKARAIDSEVKPTTRHRVGGAGRDRTDDPLLAKQVLSQLSYSPA